MYIKLIFLLFFFLFLFSVKINALAFTCSTNVTTTDYACAADFNPPAGCTKYTALGRDCPNKSCTNPGQSQAQCYACTSTTTKTWQCTDSSCGNGSSCSIYNYSVCNYSTLGCDNYSIPDSVLCTSTCPTPTPTPTPNPSTCTNQCTPGSSWCVSSTTYNTCDLQTNGCYDGGSVRSCPSDQTCSNGACVPTPPGTTPPPGVCPTTGGWEGGPCTQGSPNTPESCSGANSTTCNFCSVKSCFQYSGSLYCWYNDRSQCYNDPNFCRGLNCSGTICIPGTQTVTCSGPNACTVPSP